MLWRPRKQPRINICCWFTCGVTFAGIVAHQEPLQQQITLARAIFCASGALLQRAGYSGSSLHASSNARSRAIPSSSADG